MRCAPVLLGLLSAVLVCLSTAGCDVPPGQPVAALLGADLASVVVFGRSVEDLVYSGITGRDCSIVRLDQGKTYCRPVEPPPQPVAFCTRSLGAVDCWANPQALPGHPRELADGPRTLTPAQEQNRTRHWPNLLPDL